MEVEPADENMEPAAASEKRGAVDDVSQQGGGKRAKGKARGSYALFVCYLQLQQPYLHMGAPLLSLSSRVRSLISASGGS